MSSLTYHFIEQSLFPSEDKPQWLAFLVLNKLYPNLTYLSLDGYHCHGIADYSEDKMYFWQDRYKGGILNWRDKTLIKPQEKNFCDMTTEEIINVWTELNGATEASKVNWLRSLK